MYMLSFRTVIVTVCERTGERCDAVYLSHLREGGTQNYKVVKNKKRKEFYFFGRALPQTHDDPIGDWSSLREDQSPC